MGLIAWLADKMIFEATRNPVESKGGVRQSIGFSGGSFEAWVISELASNSEQSVFALKFPGTGGRAERGGPHPLDLIRPDNHEVWTINPPGYGGSDGRPSLKSIVEVCDAAWQSFADRAGTHRKLVVGNSLGCMYALYVAARYPVDGIFIRNPVPLREIILGRYSWWNLGIGARMVANQVPRKMDSIQNAEKCKAPALFVMSELDRVIPPEYQQQIIDSYAGPKNVFVVDRADHHESVPEEQVEEYVNSVTQFGNRMLQQSQPDA